MALAKEVLIITGCSGRTGIRVAHQFADPRFLVVGLDLLSPKITSTNFNFIQCDISNSQQLEAARKRIQDKYGSKIASIVHLIPYGTQEILEMAKQFETEQCIFASSILVNVPCEPGQRINEYWPVGPTTELARLQLEAEDILRAEHGKIPLVILRRACHYDEMCHHAPLAEQIQRIYEQQPAAFFFPGNLSHGSSYIHYDDVADIIWLTVQRRFSLPNVTIFVAAEHDVVSYDELQKIIGTECSGEDVKTWSIPRWAAKLAIRMEWMCDIPDNNYACNTNLIQEKLGWVPRHAFRQVLPKMIAALKENPQAWYRANSLKFPEIKR